MVVDEEDGWVVASLSDASMAAEILLQLRRSRAPTRLDRTDRRHSRTTVATHEDEQKEEEHGGGASPSTPLSWSGASSLSCGAERESSRAGEVEPTSMSRSQVSPLLHASNCMRTTMKRSRKKKTLAELHEEESCLLKEQTTLRHDLTKLLHRVEKQKAVNVNLKKRKNDLQEQMSPQPDHVTHVRRSSCPPPMEDDRVSAFILPDLNMPAEE